ncbi:MAG: hypothetical protein AVDCRST_MAG66-2212 [uncultured Pseudonocardia sp.]|uniref:Uncharacterized protein n=1 Tax=uncultured Pseudonocardia sp. TaxID=211455 RepID=A0A6J4PL56_9PSEU|nr:MAG: hypothetical protein AVDCRST_MAG66-2212 [uncultured Pseudonocardia sp.]
MIDQPPTRWRRNPARPLATWYTSHVSERQRADHRHSASRSARPGAAGERA